MNFALRVAVVVFIL